MQAYRYQQSPPEYSLTQLNFCAKTMFPPTIILKTQIYRDLQEMQKDIDEMKKAREKKEKTPKSDEKKKAFSLKRSSN